LQSLTLYLEEKPRAAATRSKYPDVSELLKKRQERQQLAKLPLKPVSLVNCNK
jgi:hypothetical protein